MKCTNCEEEILDANTRWAFDEPYCEECFDNMFSYCCRCDSAVLRDNTHYVDGESYCHDCYDEEFEDDSPNNPKVSKADRDLIIHLSRAWINGKVERRKLISINEKDFMLKVIRDKAGLVESSLYVYGLIDRDEYQIKASSDILDSVKEYVLINGIDATVSEDTVGTNRLAVSYSLRANNLKEIVKLIKSVATIKKMQLA